MSALKKKPKATKCSDHCTISLVAHTANIVWIVWRRIDKKIEIVLGEDQFGFRSGKGSNYAIGMLRIISEWTLAIDDELFACFIDWQKACDYINWTKLTQALKGTGTEWHNRRFISKLYMDRSGKLRQEVWRLEEELDSDAESHGFY
jgi:hypothetical protein